MKTLYSLRIGMEINIFFDGWNHGIPIVNLFLDYIRIKVWEGMERHDSGLELAAVELTRLRAQVA
jgi:hypothetical protein